MTRLICQDDNYRDGPAEKQIWRIFDDNVETSFHISP